MVVRICALNNARANRYFKIMDKTIELVADSAWETVQDLLNRHIDNFICPATIVPLSGGRSNPNYLVKDQEHRAFVLRARPPGQLHPSAHRIDREVRVLRGLERTDVPVPRVRLWHPAATSFGSAFYVMDYVTGLVDEDAALRRIARPLRTLASESAIRVLASLHQIDPADVGLDDYGSQGDYNARQIQRWALDADKLGTSVALSELARALMRDPPTQNRRCIVHGDFRWGNMLLDPSDGSIAAVLDWELSTLGDPWADLAYFSTPYLLPRTGAMLPGLCGLNLKSAGLPPLGQLVELYSGLTRQDLPSDWPSHQALALLRFGAISLGVVMRQAVAAGHDPNADDICQIDMIAQVGLSILSQQPAPIRNQP